MTKGKIIAECCFHNGHKTSQAVSEWAQQQQQQSREKGR